MLIKDNEVADIATPSGNMRAHIFRPAAPGKYPAILMFSEIFQVTAPIRRTAAMLADHGFIVACLGLVKLGPAAGAISPPLRLG